MFNNHLLVLMAFALVGLATPFDKRWVDMREKHSWVNIPRGWELHTPAPANHTLDMHIWMKQAGLDNLLSDLLQVSDPTHRRYGAHLTKEEVDARVAPHPDSVELVESWLKFHGVDPSSMLRRSGAGDRITIRVSVAEAEQLLGTRYSVYRHPDTDSYIVRTVSYSLPSILHEHVDLVTPTTYFGNMLPMKSTHFLEPASNNFQALTGAALVDTVAADCNIVITPRCLRALYKTENYTASAYPQNTLGVAGYLEEYANRADFKTFLRTFRQDASNATFETISVNGGLDDQTKPGTEANLDIQYTEAMSFPIPNVYYSTGGSPPFHPDSQTPTNTNEPYWEWLDYVSGLENLPRTFTTSYGDDEQTVPVEYARKVCDSLMQLGTRGSSVLFASGDFGVGGGDCENNDGTGKVAFQPVFPASCPWVTAVGGTTGVSPETAVSFSGGGFSRYFDRPQYQDAVVATFLSNIRGVNPDLFNRNGRGFPDVAAQARNFQVVVGGKVISVGGTSASTPVFTGVVALLNDRRMRNNMSSLGFLNPLLYNLNGKGLADITTGNNPGCKTQGFSATVGWDPVTGLGTPDFQELLNFT